VLINYVQQNKRIDRGREEERGRRKGGREKERESISGT